MFKRIIQNELRRAFKHGKYSLASPNLKEPKINDYVEKADFIGDVDKCLPCLGNKERFGDAGIIDEWTGNIHIYDIGTHSLMCKEILSGSKNKNKTFVNDVFPGDGAKFVNDYKKKQYEKEFDYGRYLHIKPIGFDTDTGAIDKASNKVLKEIATLVCNGQLPGNELPSNSDIAMRHQYLLKQLSVGFIKWRSKTFNDSIKLYTCDEKPNNVGRVRVDCRYFLPASAIHPYETHNIAINRLHALAPIFFSAEDQDNSEMINNIVNLTSSYTELVDNLDSGSVPRPLTALSV